MIVNDMIEYEVSLLNGVIETYAGELLFSITVMNLPSASCIKRTG